MTATPASTTQEGKELVKEKSIYQAFNLKTDDNNNTRKDAATATATTTTPPSEQAAEEGDEKQLQQRKGRLYGTKYAQQPGGLRVEDMIFGVKMAHLSCTDDTEGRLKGSGANTIACLEHIVGEGDEARKPLSILLKEHFNLNMDCWIDESGVRHGRAVDTQGFIASNDTTIVLSYRFSTSGLDWITNLSMTSSEWEPDRDELIGHAGICSCVDGLWTKYFSSKGGKPRVHTGFYNNFVYTIPMIRKHILEPLLKADATPKKVYICGCSLGAAIATLAFCFILEEMQPSLENPDFVNHKLINITAGCPRVGDSLMQETVMARLAKLRPLDRAVLCRLVYNHDLVPHIPFHFSGFVHFDKLVYITLDGKEVIINPMLQSSKNFAEVKAVFNSFFGGGKKKEEEESSDGDTAPNKSTKPDEEKTAFEIECEKTPEPIKDHMPYWYLTFLEKLKIKADAGEV